jgi:hypothetical protein
MDFGARVIVTNSTIFTLGRLILFVGLVLAVGGGVAYYTGDFLMPMMGWFAAAVPTLVIGTIMIFCGISRL